MNHDPLFFCILTWVPWIKGFQPSLTKISLIVRNDGLKAQQANSPEHRSGYIKRVGSPWKGKSIDSCVKLLPLQGVESTIVQIPQGVALGYRLIAPSGRKPTYLFSSNSLYFSWGRESRPQINVIWVRISRSHHHWIIAKTTALIQCLGFHDTTTCIPKLGIEKNTIQPDRKFRSPS